MESCDLPSSEGIPTMADNMMTPLVMSNAADGNLVILLCSQSNTSNLTNATITDVVGRSNELNESVFSTETILQSSVGNLATSNAGGFSMVACSDQNEPMKDNETIMKTQSAAILLSCSYCSRLFLSYRQLTQHVWVCRRTIKAYHCFECHTGFAEASRLYRHQLSHASMPAHDIGTSIIIQEANSKGVDCFTCGKVCKSLDDMRWHRRKGKCIGSRPSFNDFALAPINSILLQTSTVDSIDKGSTLDAVVEMKEKESAESLVSLQDNQGLVSSLISVPTSKGTAKRKGRPVKVCVKAFTKRRGASESEKRFKCNECDKAFGKEYYLNKHKHIHGSAMPFSCSLCGKSFLSSIKYKEHCSTHGENKPFKCDLCGKGFAKMEVLRIHNRTHTGERPFECKECGKCFKQSSNLRDHARKHADIRPFVCTICQKAFTLKGDLTKHSKIHTGEKPFECDFCGMAFPRMSNLTRHRRKHTGEKPYTCEFCGKSFSRHEKCVEHRRTHTGEKPYTCEICGKSFKDSGNFCNHKKIHTVNRPRRRRNHNSKVSGLTEQKNIESSIANTDATCSSESKTIATTTINTESIVEGEGAVNNDIAVTVGNNCDASVQTQGSYLMQVGNILGSLEVALGQLHHMSHDQYLALPVNDPRVLNILQAGTEQQQATPAIPIQQASQCLLTQDGQPTTVTLDQNALQGYITLVSALQGSQANNGNTANNGGYIAQISPSDLQNLTNVDLSNVICDTSQTEIIEEQESQLMEQKDDGNKEINEECNDGIEAKVSDEETNNQLICNSNDSPNSCPPTE